MPAGYVTEASWHPDIELQETLDTLFWLRLADRLGRDNILEFYCGTDWNFKYHVIMGGKLTTLQVSDCWIGGSYNHVILAEMIDRIMRMFKPMGEYEDLDGHFKFNWLFQSELLACYSQIGCGQKWREFLELQFTKEGDYIAIQVAYDDILSLLYSHSPIQCMAIFQTDLHPDILQID